MLVVVGALLVAARALGAPFSDLVAERFATDLPATTLTAEQRTALLSIARASAAAHHTRPPEIAHAHSSVTAQELEEVLRGDYQSIEGDVGLVDSVAVLRHDVRDPVGMRLDEWLEVVAAGDFTVIKVDVKRDRVGSLIEQLSAAVTRLDVDPSRLKLNVDVLEGPGAYAGFSWQERAYTRLVLKLELADAVELARAFPQATISVGAWVGKVGSDVRYSPADAARARQAVAALRSAGAGNVVVSARWDLLTTEFVEAVAAAGGAVDVWNAPELAAPDDAMLERSRLRERYGAALGVIDFRR